MEEILSGRSLSIKFYAVVDKDSDELGELPGISQFTWNVYHIENYLIVPSLIANVVNSYSLRPPVSEGEILHQLKNAARNIMPSVIIHKLKHYVNEELVKCIDLGFPPNAKSLSDEILNAANRSLSRLNSKFETSLTKDALNAKELEISAEFTKSFESEEWLACLPGREILKQFLKASRSSVRYEEFRNQIINRMISTGYKPEGMAKVISAISSDT